jgi:Protein of unknown function (DUF3040)
VSLDAGDRARLMRIEAELAAADPALARRFRRWKSSGGHEVVAPGWSAVPGWALVVFLVGFTTWMVAPAVGSAVAVVACCGAARRWARNQEARPGDLLPWGRKGSGRR